MGRGNRESALNSARDLLFGPRRSRTTIDQTAIVEGAISDLEKGLAGAAMVFLRNNKNQIGQDENTDRLLSAVTLRSIKEALPDDDHSRIGPRDPFSYFDHSIRANPDAAHLTFDADEAEIDFVSKSLAVDLIEQIESDVPTISLDEKLVIDKIFQSPEVGPLAAQALASISLDQRFMTLQKLVRDKTSSPLVSVLRERITYQLIEGAEDSSREFLSHNGFESLWSEKTTYLRRGGNKPTLLHLYQGRETLCGKDTKLRPNAVRRGAWRDANSSSKASRCQKCEQAMPADFFAPREDSWQYSVLNDEEYRKLHRRADLKARALLEGPGPLTEDRFFAAKEEMAKEGREIANRGLARYLYHNVEQESTRRESLLRLTGHAAYTQLIEKLDYDQNRMKIPSERQLYAALKDWPEDDSDQVEEKMARLLYRINGRKLPSGIFS